MTNKIKNNGFAASLRLGPDIATPSLENNSPRYCRIGTVIAV